MKIVIYNSWGRFYLPDQFCVPHGLPTDDNDFDENFDRTDERLIAFVEDENFQKSNPRDCEFYVVEIPDNATDWIIEDYDGLEWVTYVVDGKIYRVNYEGIY